MGDKTSGPSPNESISELPYATLQRLASRLDMPCGGNQLYWRRLVEAMPEGMYDSLTVNRFAMNASRLDGSPGYALLTDMGNRGVTFEQLVSYLKSMHFDVALRELGYKGKLSLSVYTFCDECVYLSLHAQRRYGSLGTLRQGQRWLASDWCWSVKQLVSPFQSLCGSRRESHFLIRLQTGLYIGH